MIYIYSDFKIDQLYLFITVIVFVIVILVVIIKYFKILKY